MSNDSKNTTTSSSRKAQSKLLNKMQDGRYIRRTENGQFWFDGRNMYSDFLVVRPLIEQGYLYDECYDGEWQAAVTEKRTDAAAASNDASEVSHD